MRAYTNEYICIPASSKEVKNPGIYWDVPPTVPVGHQDPNPKPFMNATVTGRTAASKYMYIFRTVLSFVNTVFWSQKF